MPVFPAFAFLTSKSIKVFSRLKALCACVITHVKVGTMSSYVKDANLWAYSHRMHFVTNFIISQFQNFWWEIRYKFNFCFNMQTERPSTKSFFLQAAKGRWEAVYVWPRWVASEAAVTIYSLLALLAFRCCKFPSQIKCHIWLSFFGLLQDEKFYQVLDTDYATWALIHNCWEGSK